ncbi:glycosyltransferase family 4 protein [Egicoccus halophilus]|uniref:D-inositol 3-phosphate glycosyltransferase n=1 Tax=Egicoccus halophilus TaxID=1670830 RepID=A0A8J3ERY0_9ACTN|nr:glycosyltransferase family 4 protein [Egicoccus halophilus]GGI05979.1 hypothetical protein GCM10011354_16810 [Egicoccus halophilus]
MRVVVLDTTTDVGAMAAWTAASARALVAAGAEVRVVARSGRLRTLLADATGEVPGLEVASDGGTAPASAARLLTVATGAATAGDAILARGPEAVRELLARRSAARRWVAPDPQLLAADDGLWRRIAADVEVVLCRDEDERARVVGRFPAVTWRTQVLGTPPLARRIRATADGGRPRLRGRRIAVAGHDQKFLAPLIPALERAGAQVRVDPWRGHTRHHPPRSQRHLDWADTVLCEWALGNAVWYSERRRPDQRLVVRLHLQELATPFPHRIRSEAVDATVFVSGFTRDRAVREIGWRDRLHVLPNAVDADAFDRPKLPGAEHVLGLLGALPERKRLDRALDLLERLRAADDRFRLEVAGALPWDSAWVRQRPTEQRYYERQFERIRATPRLRHAVRFVGPVADVPGWFRHVGWILSPSDVESFHLAPAEGMASRTLPLLWEREGVHELFPAEHVVADTAAAARRVLDLRAAGELAARGQAARDVVVARYDLPVVAARWVDLLAELPTRPAAVSTVPDGVRRLVGRLPAPAKTLAGRAAVRLGVR